MHATRIFKRWFRSQGWATMDLCALNVRVISLRNLKALLNQFNNLSRLRITHRVAIRHRCSCHKYLVNCSSNCKAFPYIEKVWRKKSDQMASVDGQDLLRSLTQLQLNKLNRASNLHKVFSNKFSDQWGSQGWLQIRWICQTVLDLSFSNKKEWPNLNNRVCLKTTWTACPPEQSKKGKLLSATSALSIYQMTRRISLRVNSFVDTHSIRSVSLSGLKTTTIAQSVATIFQLTPPQTNSRHMHNSKCFSSEHYSQLKPNMYY